MNYRGFEIEPFCPDVCGDHRRPQTLAEICRNMDICCDFRAVAARGKYPGLILLTQQSWIRYYKYLHYFTDHHEYYISCYYGY